VLAVGLRAPHSARVLDADTIRALLHLEAHPLEGGFFAETWRARQSVDAAALDGGDAGERATGTAIYYLLTPETVSSMHRLRWDEVFHFYLGDPVEMLLLPPGGPGRRVTLGTDLATGARPQVVVPAGVWQGARLAAGGRVALLGTTMAPGFDPADFDIGDPEALAREWPDLAEAIRARALVRGPGRPLPPAGPAGLARQPD
jgi:predicted cupin superfamily sugar epimerase